MAEPTDISVLLGSGVYLLSHKGEVVYVGQAVNLLRRLYTHMNTKWIAFDAIAIIPCERHSLSRCEAQMIEKHWPKGNRRKHLGWPEMKVDLASLGLRVRTMRRRRV